MRIVRKSSGSLVYGRFDLILNNFSSEIPDVDHSLLAQNPDTNLGIRNYYRYQLVIPLWG